MFAASLALLLCLQSSVAAAMSASDAAALTSELDAWKVSAAGLMAKELGLLPSFDSSAAELVRFYNTKLDVERLGRLHPNAQFSLDTPFSLLTTAEFTAFLGRSFQGPRPLLSLSPSALTAPNMQDMASTQDWTTSACVNPIQNQGQCGSCWAFAVLSAVETTMCLKSPNKTLVKLSEQQLTSCDSATGNAGCQGGYPTKAIDYVAATGVCLLRDYPYVSGTSKESGTCATSCTKVQTQVKKAVSVAPGDAALIEALQTRTVVAGVAAGNDEWKQYSGGVLNSCSTAELDHAVVVVGYTDESFKIRNSWGTAWGDQGFMYLRRGGDVDANGTCGVTMEASYPSLEQ
ncbi:Aste57867_11564 [Aphanomyces stellatus]|uniref:Aste57867_11564 protein n=1 Tax=Aphanomyces stellatus TaxID=120398 RepID=A0A485KUH2_9STRA|nr:hypothetical protein As57867_011521 [Aphanomyces stellatus]VFT88423.1 Aste57867_11564 [Aphanomyces stellatus]